MAGQAAAILPKETARTSAAGDHGVGGCRLYGATGAYAPQRPLRLSCHRDHKFFFRQAELGGYFLEPVPWNIPLQRTDNGLPMFINLRYSMKINLLVILQQAPVMNQFPVKF